MPLPPHRIKYLISDKGETLTSLAGLWHCRLEEISMCINQASGRVYPELRILISNFIDKPVDVVFGQHPLTDELLSQSKGKQRSAA